MKAERRPFTADRYADMDRHIREHWGKIPVSDLAALADESYSVIAGRAAKLGMPRLDTKPKRTPDGTRNIAAIAKGYSAAVIDWARENAQPKAWTPPEEANDAREAAMILAHTGRDMRGLGWR